MQRPHHGHSMVQAALGVLLALSASASLAGWNFEHATVSGGKTTVSDGDVTATASAYSVLNGSGGKFDSGAKFASSTLQVWSGDGLGVVSASDSGSPNHAIDNKDRTDMVLFNFSKEVALSAVTIGWAQTSNYSCGRATCTVDGKPDISVLYYTGSSAAPVVSNTSSWASMLADGWRLLSNYANLTTDVAKAVNTGSDKASSSWWLVSAFNTGFGSTSGGSAGDDYFKLASLSGSVVAPPPPGTNVPEPASLALVGVALLGLLGARRRASRKH